MEDLLNQLEIDANFQGNYSPADISKVIAHYEGQLTTIEEELKQLRIYMEYFAGNSDQFPQLKELLRRIQDANKEDTKV